MSVENGKVCCNCKHCIRSYDEKYDIVVCHCDVNKVYLSYAEVMSGWCGGWKRVRMPEIRKGHKINQHSYPAKWLCSEFGAKHFDFGDKFCSECGVNVEEGE